MRRLSLAVTLAASLLACPSPSSTSSGDSPKKGGKKEKPSDDTTKPTKSTKKKGDDVPPVASASASAAPAVPPHLEDRDIVITHFDDKATLHAWIPAGWDDHHNGEFQAPVDPATPYAYGQSLISFWFGPYECTGGCKDSDFERELHALIAGVKASAEKPNYNTGDAELDAVRLDVTELEKGKLPDGEYVAIRVKRPPGLDAPTSVDELHAVCSRHRKGDDFYFYASVTIHTVLFPHDEETTWPILLEACKKAEAKDGAKIDPKK